jgi:hypothetical protein
MKELEFRIFQRDLVESVKPWLVVKAQDGSNCEVTLKTSEIISTFMMNEY